MTEASRIELLAIIAEQEGKIKRLRDTLQIASVWIDGQLWTPRTEVQEAIRQVLGAAQDATPPKPKIRTQPKEGE